MYAPSFCRTVVQPPRFICPNGCEVITQTLVNSTSNTTRQVTRCACRAGNQPCPGSYIGCICQPAYVPSLNASTSYVLCSTQADLCNTFCQQTVGTYGPLCPFIPDATLLDPAYYGPIYPQWGGDLAAQGQATAVVAPGTSAAGLPTVYAPGALTPGVPGITTGPIPTTPIGRRLLRWKAYYRRHLRSAMTASDSSSRAGSSQGASGASRLEGASEMVWFPELRSSSSSTDSRITARKPAGQGSGCVHSWQQCKRRLLRQLQGILSKGQTLRALAGGPLIRQR